MKILLDWLQDFVEVPKDLIPEEFGALITKHTAEVEEVESLEARYDKIVIGQIERVWKHPDANRLNLTLVNVGEAEPVQIVCGGQNLVEGMLVAVARPGAIVDFHGEGPFEIKHSQIRGQESQGMICAGEEIWMEPDNAPGAKEDVKIKDLSHLKAAPGTPVTEALGIKGLRLDIDNKSLTHRPDLWGHYGFAREASAIWGGPLRLLDEFLYDGAWGDTPLRIKIERDDICPRFSACIVSGVRVEASPQWMQSRLAQAGMNPINNIVDITNYVMLELGQPMHAYDRQQLGGDEMTVSAGRSDVKLVTLDGAEHELHEEDPVIYSASGEALTIAGIKGGLKSGIQEGTTEIVLEAANWDAVMIRKASARHQLRTDASQRFEKRLDPGMTETALRRALKLILELCPGARVVSPLVTEGSWKAPELKIEVNPDTVRSKIGLQIPTETMLHILTALDFGVRPKGELLEVEVPLHRATSDVDIEEDIVEEIARIHGYDKIPAELPELPAQLPVPNDERFYKHRSRELLAFMLGYTEVLNYSFYGVDRMRAAGLEESEHVKVLNYLSEDQTHMRVSLVPNMLALIEKNQKEFSEIRSFEFGRTYKEVGNYMPLEEKNLLFALAKNEDPFYEAKGNVEDYLASLGLSGAKFTPETTPPPYAHPKKCVRLSVRGQDVGHVFTVHPGVVQAFGIERPVAMVELNFSALMRRGLDKARFSEPPKFPGMSFDVSVLVDERSEAGTLQEALLRSDKLIERVELFDIYQGKGIPEGKKSLSYQLALRHPERTLTDEELKTVQAKAWETLKAAGAQVRGI